MKKIIYIPILLIALISCQPMYDITPSGNMTIEMREVDNYEFTRIKLFGEIDLDLDNSSEHIIEVETDEEFQKYLLVDLRGHTLEIKRSIAASLQKPTSVKVRVSANNVSRLIAWRESNVNIVNTLVADSIELELQKSSSIRGSVDCKKMTALVHDSSKISLEGRANIVNLKINEDSEAACQRLLIHTLEIESDGTSIYDFAE